MDKRRKKKYEGLEGISKKKPRTLTSETGDNNVRHSPLEIARIILSETYGNDDAGKADTAMRFIVKGLSLLATGGKEDWLFGDDFDEFFMLYVKTLNMCGRMRTLLEENGIDFDIGGDSTAYES